MTTWICKGPVTALALFTLAGCEAGQGLGPGNGSGQGGSQSPLSRANMVDGVTIVAPSGFCIDPTNLEPRFAVMARCDGLGVAAAAGAAPRGLITVSLTDAKSGPVPSAEQVAQASQLENVAAVDQSENQVVFRAEGRIPVGGLSPVQWRGVRKIGGQTAGIAIYGPAQGEIVTRTGRDLLVQLINRSVEATPQRAAAKPPAPGRN